MNGLKIEVVCDISELKLAMLVTLAEEGKAHSSQLRKLLIKPLLAKLEKELARVYVNVALGELVKSGIVVPFHEIIEQPTPEKSGKAAKMYKLRGLEE